MDKTTVGKFIAEQRKLHALTQKQFAEKLDVTDKAVSRWETGKGYPDIETLEKISTVFGVTVNDILSGEVLAPEKKEEKADENIIDAMKTTKKVKKKWQIIAVLMALVTLFVSIFAVYSLFLKPKAEHTKMNLYSQNSASVFSEIAEAVKQEYRISSEAVCTMARINYDEKGDVTYIDMQLWDYHTSQYISIKYWLDDETLTPEIDLISMIEDRTQLYDGILFDTYIEMLTSVDLVEIVEKSGVDFSNGFALDSDEGMFLTVDEADKIELGNINYSYLYKDKELIALDSLELLNGKNFEISVFPFPTDEDDVVGSCCLIYVPR